MNTKLSSSCFLFTHLFLGRVKTRTSISTIFGLFFKATHLHVVMAYSGGLRCRIPKEDGTGLNIEH